LAAALQKVLGVARSKLGILADMFWFLPFKSSRRRTRAFVSLLSSGVLIHSSLASNNVPEADDSNAAKNLARMNCGATIDLITPDGRVAEVGNANEKSSSASALIMDDNTLSCPLQEGETTFIITFPTISLLDRFTFLNENAAAEGEMKIAVSNYRLAAGSSKWTDVNGSIPFTGQRHFNLSMVGVEARYVKLSFHVQKGGRIAALGLYGSESLQRFSARQSGITRIANTVATKRLEDVLNFNFANLYAKAHVVYVSSGAEESERRMIDDDTTTAFRFAGNDPHPIAIVELAGNERLHRVSAIYKMQPGKMEIFLLNELASDPGDLSAARPIAAVTDGLGAGKAAVNFDPRGARYVALRWTPVAFDSHGFEMAEINAFGDMPLSMLTTIELPEVYATNSPAMTFPGAGVPPTDLPSLPVVSQ
jgi:hypothetical protein